MKRFNFIFIFVLSCWATNAQFQVGHTTITFNDPARTGGYGSGGGTGRQIQSEIYYPATTAGVDEPVANGEFPVVVFGHGFVMAWSAYENIWEEMVPKGYIMVFPRTEGSFSPDHNEFGMDLAHLVGEMQALDNDNTSLFYQKLMPKTAIMGHSMGGGATILAAENNNTIETIIGLAPAETNPSAESAALNVQVPSLILSGSSDGVTPPNDHHLPIYNNISFCKYFVSITGGAHCYFANSNFNCDFGEGTSSSGISISRQDQHDILFDYITPWLDYYLYNNCSEKGTFTNLLDTDTRVTFQESCPETLLNLTPSGPLEFCDGDDVTISAPQSVEWHDQSTGNSVLVNQTETVFGFDSATCQYTDTLIVTVLPTLSTSETATICTGDTYTFPDGTTSSTSGVHTSVLQSVVSGCDSTVETTLNVVTALDTSITQNSGTLTANATGVSYQWINCETNAAISGANQQSFTPNDPGEYALVLSSGSCADTSACFTIEASSTINKTQSTFEFYPNPASDVIHISSIDDFQVILTDLSGKKLKTGKSKGSKITLSIADLSVGTYLVTVKSLVGVEVVRLVKK